MSMMRSVDMCTFNCVKIEHWSISKHWSKYVFVVVFVFVLSAGVLVEWAATAKCDKRSCPGEDK